MKQRRWILWAERGARRLGEGETAVPTALISCLPTQFFPSASGYLLIGYSKISETRRYRRRKRGDAREDENRRKRERGREVGKAEGCRKRGHRWEGCRGPYARVGVNYHYPPKTRLSFCSREFLFVSFPVARPHPPTIRELRFLRSPLPPAHPLILRLFLLLLFLFVPPST